MKHTPGPWRRQGAIIWGAEIQREVARVKTQPGEPLQDNANARLIAAAPELLEAASELIALNKESGPTEFKRCMIALEAAIAKAEGK